MGEEGKWVVCFPVIACWETVLSALILFLIGFQIQRLNRMQMSPLAARVTVKLFICHVIYSCSYEYFLFFCHDLFFVSATPFYPD